MTNFDDVVVVAKELLKTNPEWKERYAAYAKSLLANDNSEVGTLFCHGEEDLERSKLASELAHIQLQPITLPTSEAKLKMPTPLSAGGKYVEYQGTNGEAINILARHKDQDSCLYVIEQNDPDQSQHATVQAVAYAVFIRDLLRSPAGADWYKVFGFSTPVPKQLTITCMRAKAQLPAKTSTKISLGKDDNLVISVT